MSRIARIAALTALFALLTASWAAAATFQVVGKVLDRNGNPVVGATVKAVNLANPGTTYDGTTDKKGMYFVPGLLYAEQQRNWTLWASAEGLEPYSAKVVARTSDKTIYAEFDKKLNHPEDVVPFLARGFAEVRIEFTFGPPRQALAPQVDELGTPAPSGAPADDPMVQARAKIQQGDFDSAADLLQKAVEAAPTDPERRELLARVLLKAERTGEAIAQANKVVASNPDRLEPHLILADAYLAKSQNDKALAALENARKIAPDNAKVLSRVAYVASEAGKPELAIAADEQLVKAKPDDVEAWISLGELYARIGQGAKSEEAFRKVVELDPANAYKTFYNIGVSIGNRADLGDSDNKKIIEAFRKSIELNKEFAPSHRELAYALLRAGDMSGAKAELERYLAIDPKASDAGQIRETLKSLGSVKPGKK